MDESLAPLVEKVETALEQSMERHDQLVSLMERKREAFRAGDAPQRTQ